VNVHDGPSRRVGPNGLLIGRKQDCDIVSEDPSVSRRHALVRLTTEGAEIVPLGRGPIEVNGKPHDKAIALSDGDELGVPGLQLSVRIDAQRPDRAVACAWRIERARGGNFGIVHSPFMVGGGDSDDLIVQRWPAQALRLHVAQGELYLEPGVAKVTRNTREVEVGAMEQVFVGDILEFRRESFLIRQVVRDATTAVASLTHLPSRVVVEMLPRGGRVVFATAGGDRAVFLADRRLDLVIALLRPPDGFVAGDFIPDDAVRSIVWPRNPGVTRPEINVLISRCRRDLIEAGLAGSRLIERAPGGGGTRLALAPGALVTIET
jgi:FHA domain